MSRRTFTYLNKETGAVEEYDESTGELVRIQKEINPIQTLEERVVQVDLPDGRRVYVDPATRIPTDWAYSRDMGAKICDRIVNGEYIKDICDGVQFPPKAIMFRWRREVPEFAKMLRDAYEDRAEIFGDHMREIADNVDEKNYASSNVKIQTYKHLTQVDSPRFNPKNQTQVDIQSDQKIVIITGILRGEEQEALPAEEVKKIESEDN